VALDQKFSGASEDFPALLRRKGLMGTPAVVDLANRANDQRGQNWKPTEATTILAFKFSGGVLVAGDRRATSGNTVVFDRADKVLEIDRQRIMEMIPHRHPFLMIDKIVDAVPNLRATGIKNVSINEYFFQGHFPTRPVMPGVLIIEAMAQTAAVLVVHTLGQDAEGGLLCPATPKIETDRTMDVRQLFFGESLRAQRVEAVLVGLAAADRADVARVLIKDEAQGREIEFRIMREDDHV